MDQPLAHRANNLIGGHEPAIVFDQSSRLVGSGDDGRDAECGGGPQSVLPNSLLKRLGAISRSELLVLASPSTGAPTGGAIHRWCAPGAVVPSVPEVDEWTTFSSAGITPQDQRSPVNAFRADHDLRFLPPNAHLSTSVVPDVWIDH